MKRRAAILFSFLAILMCTCCADINAAKKTETKYYLEKSGYEYDVLKYELEDYKIQAELRKRQMEETSDYYVKNINRSSFEAYKEAELSYGILSFYEKYGEMWMLDQWNQKEGSLRLEIVAYQLNITQMKYQKAVLREARQKYKEAGKKREKGMLTAVEYEEIHLQVQSAKEQLQTLQKSMRQQKKDIVGKMGGKKITDVKTPPKRSREKYFALWKKNKSSHAQMECEIEAYKKYQEGFQKDVPEQATVYQYAENKVNLLSLEKKKYLTDAKKNIWEKSRECSSYERMKASKKRELRVAKQKLEILKLLKRKGQIVESEVLEQKSQIEKLKYEKASYQYEIEKRCIELEFCMEEV